MLSSLEMGLSSLGITAMFSIQFPQLQFKQKLLLVRIADMLLFGARIFHQGLELFFSLAPSCSYICSIFEHSFLMRVIKVQIYDMKNICDVLFISHLELAVLKAP